MVQFFENEFAACPRLRALGVDAGLREQGLASMTACSSNSRRLSSQP
jgi:hypothetical protein